MRSALRFTRLSASIAGRMMEVRGAVQKAESDLDQVFNEDTVDQRRGRKRSIA